MSEADATEETLREKFMRKIGNDPQFQEAEKSGQAFVLSVPSANNKCLRRRRNRA